MFNFLHPEPVVDGRAVAVTVVQQKASALQDNRTLIVKPRNAEPTGLTAKDGGFER